jgi:hypothetical protein
MPNPLTGEFEAVLQVNGRVIDRLMASLHQNTSTRPDLPSFPHSVFLRIGDPQEIPIGQQHAIPAHPVATPAGPQAASPLGLTAAAAAMADALQGVRGSVRAQAGAPRIELLNGARNRVIVEVPIRARYSPDPGSTPLPEFIHGVVRAEYSVHEITVGQRRLLRLSVSANSVAFHSAGPDTSADARVARQISRLLQTTFRPADQPARFRPNVLKSLAGGGTSAVVVALAFSGGEPEGSLDTYTQILLDGRDFAVAVSAEFIMSMIEPILVGVRSYHKAHGDYDVQVTNADASYAGGALGLGLGSAGIITIHVKGSAITGSDVLPNVDIDVTQLLRLGFDEIQQAMTLDAVGPPVVGLEFSNVLGYLVRDFVRAVVSNIVSGFVTDGLAAAAPELASITSGTSTLDQQLKSLDADATSRFTEAEFTPHGFILRGPIWLSPRIAPVIEFDRLSTLDGYSAWKTWIPGGRIDEFHWRWSWFFPTKAPLIVPPAAGATTLSHADRFIMHAPAAVPGIGSSPGSNVMTGAICLFVSGVQIDAQSGAQVAVDTSMMITASPSCHFFSPQLHADVPRGRDRLLARMQLRGANMPDTVWPEVAVIDIAGPHISGGHNALICYCPETPRADDFRVVGQAIAECRRTDAGLLVVVVVAEDVAAGRGAIPTDVREAIGAIRADVLVTEDVRRGWAGAFDADGDRRGMSVRLLTPAGRVVASFAGPVEARRLAEALREHLVAGPLPAMERLSIGVQPGSNPPSPMVELAHDQQVPLRALRGSAVVLCFARLDSESSDAQLRRLERMGNRYAGRPAQVVAIVDQADARAADELKRKLSLGFHVSGDIDGTATGRWGVRVWPTTVIVDERGVVERVEMGTDAGAMDASEKQRQAT